MSPYFKAFIVLFIVVALSVFGCTKARAEGFAPDYVGIHVGSYHTTKIDAVTNRPWNNANPGAYLRWDNVVAGTYYNSIRRQSVYVGYAYPLTKHFDVVVGAITGYNGPGYSAKAVMPMIVPSFHFPISNGIEGRVHVIPKAAKGGSGAVHFSVEFKL